MECNVCLESMKTLSFKKTESEDALDSDDPACMRLKCGHAFHVQCAMGAIRTVGSCPSCRDPVIQEPESESEDEDIYSMFELTREILRKTDPDVKRVAKELQQSLSEYRKHANMLKKERKDIVCEALKVFTERRKREHTRLSRNVHRQMLKLKKIETNKLLQHSSEHEEQVRTYIEAVQDLDYCAKDFMATSFDYAPDPLYTRFWKG